MVTANDGARALDQTQATQSDLAIIDLERPPPRICNTRETFSRWRGELRANFVDLARRDDLVAEIPVTNSGPQLVEK